MLAFRILYEDDLLIAIDKPAGFHSHPPEDKKIKMNPRWNALGILQKQKGIKLFPSHRLDRATSGVLIFSKDRSQNGEIQRLFQEQKIDKNYVCLVRGAFNGTGQLSENLNSEYGQETAITLAEELQKFTLPIADPQGARRHFTLVWASPITGRYHQIRRHFAQIGLPLVGDRQHGDKKLNRHFTELTGIAQMLLRCREISFVHPHSGALVSIKARWTHDWHCVFDLAGVCPIL